MHNFQTFLISRVIYATSPHLQIFQPMQNERFTNFPLDASKTATAITKLKYATTNQFKIGEKFRVFLIPTRARLNARLRAEKRENLLLKEHAQCDKHITRFNLLEYF